MQVKRYEASNIKDALVKIKRELGPDAIVLSTRQLPGEKRRIEVLAAIDSGFEKKGFPEAASRSGEKDFFTEGKEDDSFSLKNEIHEMKSMLFTRKGGEDDAVLAAIKEAMDAFMDLSAARFDEKGGDAMTAVYFHLVGCGLSKTSAVRLLADIRRTNKPEGAIGLEQGLKTAKEAMKKALVKNGGADRRVKIFLGPTGVGKTTTLAKLAARYALGGKKSVGLITADTYRIGAIEQLKTYAQIIDLPLEVADSKEAFRRSMERFQNKDCILVDTPGRGGDAGGHLSRLKEMLSAEAELEVNLLLSPTASLESMIDVFTKFEAFGCDQIIFTKLDECRRCGSLYDVIEKTGKPASYITNGQNVPQDIESASPDRLAEMILLSPAGGEGGAPVC